MTDAYRPDLLAAQHVVVTGGGTGLGRAMALRFASLGARVTICGRRPEPLAQTVEEIRAADGHAEGLPCDVREPDGVEQLLESCEQRQGPVTRLVNNAAGNFLAATEGLSANAFDAVVRTNLHGTFFATQACGRRWIERGQSAAVLSIATTYTDTGSAFVVPSAVSKAGVVALTRSLAAEWGVHGIRLNAISPGPIPTEGAWKRLVPGKEAEAQLLRRIPLGRFGRPEELADVAVFLLSDLSAYVTGAVLVMDGGEALASGGQFNDLAKLPREQALAIFERLRG